MKIEIEKVVKETYPDNMKYGVEYQMDELRPEDLRKAFKDGAEWFRKSLFHKTKDEVPQPIGDYANEVYPQVPCLVKGHLSTGYGYGVRYWNVKCQVWDDEECDDYECDKEAVEEWAYLDDIIGNMED